MNAPLAGRRALVTGGTRGIGAAVSAKLVAWGAHVTAGYVQREDSARALRDRLGDRVQTIAADVTVPDEVADLVGRAADGGLDIVVHCAAAASYGPTLEESGRRWAFTQQQTLESLRGVVAAARRHLAASEHPRVVAVSNSLPHRIVPGGASLAVAKAGVETLVGYLAYELAGEGIVVNAVRPGLVATDVLTVRPDYAATLEAERAASPWPGSRTTTPADVADVIAALCLPEMAWVSGQVIGVDGGAAQWGWLGARHG